MEASVGGNEEEMQPTETFNPVTAAKTLIREGRSGALATLMTGSGDPYCSLVNVAATAAGAALRRIHVHYPENSGPRRGLTCMECPLRTPV